MPTFFLIRHAHAGERGKWEGDDLHRPLSRRGHAQAVGIADALGAATITKVLSSPATRCIETVSPLAERHGRKVETVRELREGADPTKVIALMEHHASKKGVALCGHGDVIPAVIDLLHRRGMTIDGDVGTRKGSWWAITYRTRTFTDAVWYPPPAVSATRKR